MFSKQLIKFAYSRPDPFLKYERYCAT